MNNGNGKGVSIIKEEVVAQKVGVNKVDTFYTNDNGDFIWGFSHPYAGELRFTIRQNEKGQWYEMGEVSSDNGNTWFQNFEMLLNKVE